ncbi:MAG TPA: mechanosensitive ion channel family protein [Candidatus Saccharimonadales bacterium]|nr:mechanosensitive ion channel family protein [Candidatus Saccharimonadales bacterium]
MLHLPTINLASLDLSLPVSASFGAVLHNLPTAAVTLVIGFIVIRLLSFIAGWLIGYIRMPKGLKEIFVSLIDTVLAIFLFIIVLQALGLNNVAFVVTALVAGLGIALGNGGIPLMTDIISGIYLARDRNFSIGDIVQAGEPGEGKVEGEVVSMDMRRTRIRDSKGHIHSLPNTVIERHAFVLITKKRDRTDIK